ncbi:hypothetical protein AB0O05_38360 [Streptomyces sp. NPDC093084]|uniref:hypothetical protein n=1 Tax=Streptomyces sp. NPDC093084 TaxID=3155197 RepID=UPI0034349D08
MAWAADIASGRGGLRLGVRFLRGGYRELQAAAHVQPDLVVRRAAPLLYRHGMAVTDIAGVEQRAWSAYIARGQAPAPDDHVGREPVWHLSTVLRHIDTRPGRPSKHA